MHVSHLKLGGERSWGQADKVLAFLDDNRRAGLDVTWDQYVYTAASTTLSSASGRPEARGISPARTRDATASSMVAA